MTLKFRANPSKYEIQEAYQMGRRHRGSEFQGGSLKINPYPHDPRGWAYLAGQDDYALQWDVDLGGPTPTGLDTEAEWQIKRNAPMR
jgi:hypothetical protein